MSEWTPNEQRAVAQALLGSWPGTMTQWGRDAFGAYINELRARGLSAQNVLTAIRTWPAGSDFPPSAPNLAAQARVDPTRPTFEEVFQLIYGRGGILRARPKESSWPDMASRERAYQQAAKDRAAGLHPLVAEFVLRQGIDRLRRLEVDHETFGDLKRRELREAWDRHCEAFEGREVHVLVSGERRDGLSRFDPLAGLGWLQPKRREIETGRDSGSSF